MCSYPAKVDIARSVLPDRWAQELVEDQAPDYVWLAVHAAYEGMDEKEKNEADLEDVLHGLSI
jgi:hypothetical protein